MIESKIGDIFVCKTNHKHLIRIDHIYKDGRFIITNLKPGCDMRWIMNKEHLSGYVNRKDLGILGKVLYG